jgi:cation transport ATPase
VHRPFSSPELSTDLLSGPAGDRSAVLLSGLCVLHCLALPIAAAFLPWLAWATDHETWVHRALLMLVVPVSLWALLRGGLRHRDLRALLLGSVGLALLGIAALAGVERLHATAETAITVLGSLVLACSHLLNVRALNRASR